MQNKPVEIITCLLENIIIIQIINSIIVPKRRSACLVIICFLTFYAMSVNTMVFPYLIIVPVIALIIYGYFNYDASRKRIIAIVTLVFIANAALSAIFISLLMFIDIQLFQGLLNDPIFYLTITFTQKFLLIYIILLLRKFVMHIDWLLVFVESIIYFICILHIFYCMIRSIVPASHSTLLFACFTILILTCIVLINKYHTVTKDKMEIEYRSYIRHTYNDLYEEKSASDVEFVKYIHDVMFVTQELRKILEQHNQKEALECLDKLTTLNVPVMLNTSNNALNYIINLKDAYMSKHKIKLAYFINDDLSILDDYDLISLLDAMFAYAVLCKPSTINLTTIATDFGARVIIKTDHAIQGHKIKTKIIIDNIYDILYKYHTDISYSTTKIDIIIFNQMGR